MTVDKELLEKIKITPLIDTLKLEDIDDAVYFSEKYSGYISNSRLGVLKKDGVEAFFKGIPQVYSSAFEFGSLCHQQVLQPDKFEVVSEVFKPTAKAGLMADALYNSDGTTPTDDDIKSMSYKIGYYKDKLTTNRLTEFRAKAEPYWRDRYIFEQNNPVGKKERIYTDERSYDILTNCLRTLGENEQIQRLLNPEGLLKKPVVGNEKTILMDIQMEIPDYEPRTYKLKAKLDNFTVDFDDNAIIVNDLKTCGKPVSMFDPLQYSYQREIAFYSYLLKLVAKKYYDLGNSIIKGNFLVVSTVPEYDTLVYPMSPKLFKMGFEEVKYLLRCIAYFNQVKGYDF